MAPNPCAVRHTTGQLRLQCVYRVLQKGYWGSLVLKSMLTATLVDGPKWLFQLTVTVYSYSCSDIGGALEAPRASLTQYRTVKQLVLHKKSEDASFFLT